jgi:hypothetical protein
MSRHIFLIPGFFGFANLGDFTYWGHVYRILQEALEERGAPARIHAVKSLPTASLRARTRCLLETIVQTRPRAADQLHLIGHSTGGLDARLLLTPAVDLRTPLNVENYAPRVRSTVSIATPHFGAPIASFFASVLGRQLLRLLSVLTMATLRTGRLPLSVWTEVAGLFAASRILDDTTGTLATQLYRQLLADFNEERRAQVSELLQEVERDQSLLTQLTLESMDLFNAAAGNRDGVHYGSVVTRARRPGLAASLQAGVKPRQQAQHALYYSLSRLAGGRDFPAPDKTQAATLRKALGDMPAAADNDGIVPTLSQPWGHCIAAVQADHLDIIGHYREEGQVGEQHYDWLNTRSEFDTEQFRAVWSRVADFIVAAEQ